MNGESNALPVRRVDLDVAIRGLLPERELRVKAVGVDEYALRLVYEVMPPIAVHGWEDAIKEEAVAFIWLLSGQDDLGNRYEDGGGAYGLAEDGTKTEGVHSLQPVPAPNASWIDLAFIPASEESSWENARFVLRVRFPLEAELLSRGA